MINSYPSSYNPLAEQRRNEAAREIESLVWAAAGAAWAFVAIRAWNRNRVQDSRRRLFQTTDRLLSQVFPNGI